MYLNRIEITHVSPCFADSSKIRLKASLSDDVTEMMPYRQAAGRLEVRLHRDNLN